MAEWYEREELQDRVEEARRSPENYIAAVPLWLAVVAAVVFGWAVYLFCELVFWAGAL